MEKESCVGEISFINLYRLLGDKPVERKLVDDKDIQLLAPFINRIRQRGESVLKATISGNLDPTVDYGSLEKPVKVAGVGWGREESRPLPNEEEFNTYHLGIYSIPGESLIFKITSIEGEYDASAPHWSSQKDIDDRKLGKDSLPNEFTPKNENDAHDIF